MKQDKSHLQSDLAALLEQRQQDAEAHPQPSTLLEYAADQLVAEQAEALREHLALCPLCTQIVLEASGEGPTRAAVELSPSDLEEQWHSLSARIHSEAPRTSAPPSPGLEETIALSPNANLLALEPRGDWALRWFQVLAASLLLTTLAALFWGWTSHRPGEPEINLPIVSLQPAPESTRGAPSGAEERLVVVPSEAKHVALWLVVRPFYDPDGIEDFGVELLEADGEPLWSRWGLRRLSSPGFQILLPRSLVGDGSYQLRLLGKRGEEAEELALYSLRFERETGEGDECEAGRPW